jgi:hypothetical protein
MFAPNSRYAKMPTSIVTLSDGRTVTAVTLPLPASPPLLGFHRRHTGQRLDLIASHYLADATGFWRLCDANDSMSPDALGARDLIGIAGKGT